MSEHLKHMPTPWSVGHGPGNEVEIWGRMRMGNSPILASLEHDPREANAAFIVRACNAHGNLVSALTELLRVSKADVVPVSRLNAAHEKARAALAKAKGESAQPSPKQAYRDCVEGTATEPGAPE